MCMAMRDVILEAINNGGATRQTLLELTGTTEKGLASQFTYLRMLGHCPMKKDDGTYCIVSPEVWAERSEGKPGTILTPAEKLAKAQKREQRASVTLDNAIKRFEANQNRVNELRKIKAEVELEISSIELSAAEAAYKEQTQDSETTNDDLA